MKYILFFMAMALLITGCGNNNLIDTNETVAGNNWLYSKSAKAIVEIKEPNQLYSIHFKLRHTLAYRYANIFVVMRLKGDSVIKSTRYEFKLAKNDGEWLGKGSGDIYSYNFALLKGYRFAKAGKYEIEVTQNMRDNPLIGISDVGITVSKQTELTK